MKINFYDRQTREIKPFETLQEMSDYIEEIAYARYKKDFMKANHKDIYFKLIKKSNKKKVISYKVTLHQNRRILGTVQIPTKIYVSPTKDFMIRVEKSKYKEKEKND